MNIGINLLLLLPHVGGVANYVMTFLREWPKYYPDNSLVLFSFPGNETLLDRLPPEIRQNEIKLLTQPEILKHINKFDVFFCPFGSLSPRPIQKPSVITIVDIQERFYPDFFERQDIKNRLYHYDTSLKMADQIVTISEFSCQSIIQVIGVQENKMNVIYLSADKLPEKDSRPSLPDEWGDRAPFIFYPANDWPHKNHLRLVEALAILKQSGLVINCVLTGTCQDLYREIRQSVDDRDLKDQILHLEMVSREEIAWLYRHARMLIFPSLFEGFGIPVVEAMACGLPVVCSGITSLPEVGGKAALYFNPDNSRDMADKIQKVYTDNQLRDKMISLGKEHHNRFTTESMIRQHKKVFEKARNTYRGHRYYKHKLFDEPFARILQRASISNPQRKKAEEILRRSSYHQTPDGI